MEMIAKIPGVDVVVGGHSHTLLSNNPTTRRPALTRPGRQSPRLQGAGRAGRLLFEVLGELNVTFNDIGIVKEAKGDPTIVDKSINPDPAVLKRVAELAAPIEELKNKEVGETAGPIDGSRDNCRAKECEMGNLVADAMLDRVKDQGVTIVIHQWRRPARLDRPGRRDDGRSAHRAAVPEHRRDLPDQGRGYHRRAGERRQQARGRRRPVPAGRRPEILLRRSEAGRRPHHSVEVMEGGNWGPIDPAKTYTAATNNYVRRRRRRLQGVRRKSDRTPTISAPAWNRWLRTI